MVLPIALAWRKERGQSRALAHQLWSFLFWITQIRSMRNSSGFPFLTVALQSESLWSTKLHKPIECLRDWQ